MKAVSILRLILGSVALFAFAVVSLQAQISIAALNSAVTQNFNSIGTSTTATLPTNWLMSPQSGGASPTWGAGVSAVTQGASSGTPTAGGRYNWGLGSDTSDRAIGFMTSGGYSSPNSVMAYFQNNTGSTITSLTINYDIERYRINTAAASVSMFYSLNGTSWTAISNSTSTFSTGSSSYTFSSPTTDNKSISLTGLGINTSSSIYLRWNFDTTGSNSQGLGLDNVSVTAIPEPSTYAAIFGALALAGVMIHRRRKQA